MKENRPCCVCGSKQDGKRILTYFNGKSDVQIFMSGDCCICEECLNKCVICSRCGKKIKTDEIKEALGDMDSLTFCHCEEEEIITEEYSKYEELKQIKADPKEYFKEEEKEELQKNMQKIFWCILIAVMFGVTTEYWQVGVAVFLIGLIAYFRNHLRNLPRSNYHILGYITTIYLLFITIYAWDNKIDYGYYEVLRWIVSCFAFWTAYKINQKQNNIWFLIFMTIGVLFNPIIKIALDKDVWQIIDLITFVLVCIYGYKNRTNV